MTLCNTFWRNMLSRLNTLLHGALQLLMTFRFNVGRDLRSPPPLNLTYFVVIAGNSRTASLLLVVNAKINTRPRLRENKHKGCDQLPKQIKHLLNARTLFPAISLKAGLTR